MPFKSTAECVTRILATLALLACLTPGTPSAWAALALEPIEEGLPRRLRPAQAGARCGGEPLNDLVARWRRHLDLLDWRIVVTCRMLPGDAEEFDGKVFADVAERQAIIFLDPDPSTSIEEVLVHELVHVKLHDLRATPDDEDSDEAFTQLLTHRMLRPARQ